jgi:hypothetical protein
MQFTLPKLFLAVTLTAIACAGMLSPTHLWTNLIATLTIGMFGLTAIRAIGLRRRERIFAIVFAIAGFGYLLLALSPVTKPVARTLVTNYPIAWFVTVRDPQLFVPPVASTAATPSYSAPVQPPPIPTITTTLPNGTQQISVVTVSAVAPHTPLEPVIFLGFEFDDQYNPVPTYFLIGHCVWSWLIALLAAWFAGRMYARRQATPT